MWGYKWVFQVGFIEKYGQRRKKAFANFISTFLVSCNSTRITYFYGYSFLARRPIVNTYRNDPIYFSQFSLKIREQLKVVAVLWRLTYFRLYLRIKPTIKRKVLQH